MNELRSSINVDFKEIAAILTHPEINRWISDDHFIPESPSACEELIRMFGDHVLIKKGSEPMGSFSFIPRNSIMAEIHSAILPQFRGQNSADAARIAFNIAFRELEYEKIITWCPVDNPAALHLARKVGMKDEGIVTKSFYRNGVLVDQVLLGITKEEFTCH